MTQESHGSDYEVHSLGKDFAKIKVSIECEINPLEVPEYLVSSKGIHIPWSALSDEEVLALVESFRNTIHMKRRVRTAK
jgi:hypothetical protein